MRVAKWGNSLALRIPAEVVRRLGLHEGATVEAQITVDGKPQDKSEFQLPAGKYEIIAKP
jgi:antitoxin component of MazEF toxin-antitoxin module